MWTKQEQYLKRVMDGRIERDLPFSSHEYLCLFVCYICIEDTKKETEISLSICTYNFIIYVEFQIDFEFILDFC